MRLVSLTLVVLAATAPALAAPRGSACQRLKGRDLARSPSVKLVEHGNDYDGENLLGCVLPRGPLRLVAQSVASDSSGVDYKLRRVVGSVVLVESSEGDPDGGTTHVIVVPLRTGKRYEIARECFENSPNAFCPHPPDTDHLEAVVVNRLGQSAIALSSPDGSTMSIVGFSATGVRATLDTGARDDIPASSLALAGSTASWTHSGEARSADLSFSG